MVPKQRTRSSAWFVQFPIGNKSSLCNDALYDVHRSKNQYPDPRAPWQACCGPSLRDQLGRRQHAQPAAAGAQPRPRFVSGLQHLAWLSVTARYITVLVSVLYVKLYSKV